MTLYCQADISYFAASEPVAVVTEILNGRSQKFDWRMHGFQLLEHRSAITDWEDRNALMTVHNDELASIAKVHTGCDAVIFFLPLSRKSRNIDHGIEDPEQGPILGAHSDYAENYHRMLSTRGHPYLSFLKASMERYAVDEGRIRDASRVITLQFWRNIGPQEMDYPLAFCDAQTVPRERLLAMRLERVAGADSDFDFMSMLPPGDGDAFAWYTFPDMTKDEVVLFRAFDSDRVKSGAPFWTPHTAFRDPNLPDGAPERESLEMRAICLFD